MSPASDMRVAQEVVANRHFMSSGGPEGGATYSSTLSGGPEGAGVEGAAMGRTASFDFTAFRSGC